MRALGMLKAGAATEVLIRRLSDESYLVQTEAAYALGRIGVEKATKPLMVLLKDKNPAVRGSAVEALGLIGSADAFEALWHVSRQDKSFHVRQAASKALLRLDSPTKKPGR